MAYRRPKDADIAAMAGIRAILARLDAIVRDGVVAATALEHGARGGRISHSAFHYRSRPLSVTILLRSKTAVKVMFPT